MVLAVADSQLTVENRSSKSAETDWDDKLAGGALRHMCWPTNLVASSFDVLTIIDPRGPAENIYSCPTRKAPGIQPSPQTTMRKMNW